jgi:hypothetical protein
MVMTNRILFAILLTISGVVAQEKLTVQWVLLNATDGSPLPNHELIIDGDTLLTDTDGFLNSDHTKQPQTLLVQMPGTSLGLARDTFSLDTSLQYQQFTLEAVSRTVAPKAKTADMVVLATREPLHLRKEVSKITVSRAEMREIAAVQNDPLQVLRTLPGVTSQNDANNRPYVRGGDWWETRVFWNGVPVVQPFHATSMYSVFNMEAIEDMTFYSGGFPVEGSNSLSGALWLRSRPAPLDTFAFWTQISMLKGHMWTGIPVVKDRFGISIAYQAFWYDWVIKRMMDGTTLLADDEDFSKQVDQYKSRVEMPNFKDLELSANWAITPGVRLDYTFLYAQDIFKVLEPKNDYVTDGTGSDSSPTSGTSPLDQLQQIDTLAFVHIPNFMHATNLSWNLSSRWDMLLTSAYQSQEWIVKFADVQDRPIYDFKRENLHSRLQNLVQFNSQHLFNFGLMAEWDQVDYDVYLPRFAYELLIQSNIDMMENLAFFEPEGMVMIEGEDLLDINQMAATLLMDYRGTRTRRLFGGWFSDNWTIDSKNRVTLGTRLDFETSSHSAFLSPRGSWFHKINDRHELSVSAGLYSQDNFEFYNLHLNPHLSSEKAAHLNVEYSWDITPEFKLELSNYGKFYYDLATPHLSPTGTIDDYTLIEGIAQEMGMNLDELYDWAYQQDSTMYYGDDSVVRQLVGEEMYQTVVNKYGDQTLAFDNQAIGYAYGSEAKLHYDPTQVWRGWLSLEASVSKRQDESDGPWYNFRKHRPWAIKWHNYFDMPGAWELSFRMEYSAGLVYTGYTDLLSMDSWDVQPGDTLFVVEKKNNRHYSAYGRFDIRLEKNSTFFGHPSMFFFEVWNSTNEPNFILTDSETGSIKFFDLNYPFPIVFLGYEFRW